MSAAPTFGTGLAAVALALAAHGVASAPALIEQSITVADEHDLMERLLEIVERRLSTLGVSVGRRHAQMSLSGAGVPSGEYEVSPLWSAESGPPPMPLRFEIRPMAGGAPREAYLAVPLLREVPVASRRLRKGAAFRCDDVTVESRLLASAGGERLLEQPCHSDAQNTWLKDIGAGQVVRAADLGPAYDVGQGAPVVVVTENRSVTVSIAATALTDGRLGDRVDVRLQHPVRTLVARVTGRGTVRLLGEGS